MDTQALGRRPAPVTDQTPYRKAYLIGDLNTPSRLWVPMVLAWLIYGASFLIAKTIDASAVPVAALLATLTVIAAATTLAKKFYRALIPEALRNLPLHWRDWNYATTLHLLTPVALTEVANLALSGTRLSGRTCPNLRYAHDVARAAHSIRSEARKDVYNAIDYMYSAMSASSNKRFYEYRADRTALALAGWGSKQRALAQSRHFLNDRDVLALFRAYPDLTVPVLAWICEDTPTSSLSKRAPRRLPDAVAALSAQHGQRLPYYVALGFTREEMAHATATGQSLDSLRVMTAFTS